MIFFRTRIARIDTNLFSSCVLVKLYFRVIHEIRVLYIVVSYGHRDVLRGLEGRVLMGIRTCSVEQGVQRPD